MLLLSLKQNEVALVSYFGLKKKNKQTKTGIQLNKDDFNFISNLLSKCLYVQVIEVIF